MNKTVKLLLASVITISASAAMAQGNDNWTGSDGSLPGKTPMAPCAGVITTGHLLLQ